MCLNKKFNQVLRIFTIMCILTAIILAIVFRNQVAREARKLEKYIVEHPKSGPEVILGIYILCEMLFIPAGIVTTGVGYTLSKAYDSSSKAVEVGIPLVLLAIIISATIGFLTGKFICRDSCRDKVKKYKWVRALTTAINDEGQILLVMLRMSFVIPFAALNFICGVVEIGFCTFYVSLIATLPGIIIHLFIGTSLPVIAALFEGKKQDDNAGAIAVGFVAFGTALGIGSGMYLTYVTKQKFNEIVRHEEFE